MPPCSAAWARPSIVSGSALAPVQQTISERTRAGWRSVRCWATMPPSETPTRSSGGS